MRARFRYSHSYKSLWKGAVAGAVGGFVASWAIGRVQTGLKRALSTRRPQPDAHPPVDSDLTGQGGAAFAEQALDRPLAPREHRAVGLATQYAIGSLLGAAYGILAEIAPRSAQASGFSFASGIRAFRGTTGTSVISSNLLFGVTADIVRRIVRAVL